MYKDRQLVLLKDSNIELRSQIYKLQQDFQVMRDIFQLETYKSQLNDCKTTQLEALQKEYDQFQEQSQDLRNAINAREKDLSQLNFFREKCVDMDMAHTQKLTGQQAHYGKIIQGLHQDINTMQQELKNVHDEHTRQDALLRSATEREIALKGLEDKNDSLQKELVLYENKFLALEQDVGKFEFQNKSLNTEIAKLQDDIKDKDKKILEIRGELQKLTTDHHLFKSTCKCPEKNTISQGASFEKSRSPVKRHSPASADAQINELHRRLSQKSLDSSKSIETLKRRTQEFEKQKKQALEENKRLLNDADRLVEANSGLRNKINMLELNLDRVEKELNRKNEKLRISESRETERESEWQRQIDQLEYMRRNESTLRDNLDIMSKDIEHHKHEHLKRDQSTLHELKNAQRIIKERTEQLTLADEKVSVIADVNRKLTEQSELVCKENVALKDEVLELKEKLAVVDGRKEAVTELLKATQEESTRLLLELQNLKVTKSELETTRLEIAELVAQNASLQDRHDNLQIAHQQLIDNYEKLIDTRNYAITILKIGKKMKIERMRRDNFFENKIKSMTKHIKTLLADRQQLLEQVQSLHRDNVILIDKLEGYYRCHDRYIENLPSPPTNSGRWTTRRQTNPSNLSASSTHSRSQPELRDSLTHLIEVTTTKIRSKRKNWENRFRHSFT